MEVNIGDSIYGFIILNDLDESSINKLVNTVKPYFSGSEINQAISQLKREKILN
jgi:hypothetical protein